MGAAVLKKENVVGSADAVYFTAPGQVEVRSVPVTKQKGELLVSSLLMGISHGTELLMYNGRFPKGIPADETLSTLTGDLAYPFAYGYINVGVTEERESVFCFYAHQTRFTVSPSDCIFLPNDIAPNDAVFLASMETAVGIVQDAQPGLGDAVLIVGQGVIGLLCAALLKQFHYGPVITVEKFQKRRDASTALGCISFDPSDDATVPRNSMQERIFDETGGRGMDIAINVSGSPQGMQLAIDTLAREGTLIEGSWYGEQEVTINLGTRFHRKRLTIKSSQVSRINPVLSPRWTKERRLSVAIDCLRRIHPSRYITHEFKLRDASEAFSMLATHPEETIQVVLRP